MSGMKIRKGDTVKVLTGREKGKTGKVTATNPEKRTVTISGVNIRTIHKKPSTAFPQGGVIKEEHPMDVSNVGIPTDKKKTSRVGYEFKKNKKVRVLRQSSNKEIK